MIKHSYYVENAKQDFIDRYLLSTDDPSLELLRDIDNLLNMARIHGAEQERYRILEKVRHDSAGIVVDALSGHSKQLVSLVAEKLARDLEGKTEG